MIDNVRKLLVVEVKGQWYKELYTAAAAQLHERYSIHIDAANQGIYLALWFGPDEKVAALKNDPPALKRSAAIVRNRRIRFGNKRHKPEEIVPKLQQVEVL